MVLWEPYGLPFFVRMSQQSEDLLKQNQLLAQQAMGERVSNLDWDLISRRRNICSQKEQEDPWKVDLDNFLIFPQLLPSSDETADTYSSLIEGLELGAGLEQYLDVHGKDIHLIEPLLGLRKLVADQCFDVNNNITTSENLKPYFLIAFGTGDGNTLRKLIHTYQPHHLILALSEWEDFATSFWSIDWKQISDFQIKQGKKITIGVYKTLAEMLYLLTEECFAGIDHSVVYVPPKDACSDQAKLLRDQLSRDELQRSVTYLGYTIDEHNMVWNSWLSLAKQPRVYVKPKEPLGGRMVVCGSGPSLDLNLDFLRTLSDSHLITACGSNFRTLKANGIRVDYLALVERADLVLDDVKQVVDEYGAGETRLFMSTTCHHQLLDMFVDSMVYFRPALTPLALFADSLSEVLNNEGPESINAGIAFASSIGMDELLLVGVDLGARSLKKIRSKEAVGCSVRELNIELPANFGGTVYSSKLLQDSRISVEECLKNNAHVKVLNASDGVAIKGAQSYKLEEDSTKLINSVSSLPLLETSPIGQWWNSSPRYTQERSNASWTSRRPRVEISSQISQLRTLLSSNSQWNPTVVHEITKLLSLHVSPSISFPRRVIRSTIHKLVIAINRQMMVMSTEPDKARRFENHARRLLVDLLDPLEEELYELCDTVESLPVPSREASR